MADVVKSVCRQRRFAVGLPPTFSGQLLMASVDYIVTCLTTSAMLAAYGKLKKALARNGDLAGLLVF